MEYEATPIQMFQGTSGHTVLNEAGDDYTLIRIRCSAHDMAAYYTVAAGTDGTSPYFMYVHPLYDKAWIGYKLRFVGTVTGTVKEKYFKLQYSESHWGKDWNYYVTEMWGVDWEIPPEPDDTDWAHDFWNDVWPWGMMEMGGSGPVFPSGGA